VPDDAIPARLCRLQDAVHRIELCPGERCPFWEVGGAVAEGGCAFDRVELELHAQPEVAQQLLEIRRALEQPREEQGADAARTLFFRLLDDAVRRD
jgi:hypothetical protein